MSSDEDLRALLDLRKLDELPPVEALAEHLRRAWARLANVDEFYVDPVADLVFRVINKTDKQAVDAAHVGHLLVWTYEMRDLAQTIVDRLRKVEHATQHDLGKLMTDGEMHGIPTYNVRGFSNYDERNRWRDYFKDAEETGEGWERS